MQDNEIQESKSKSIRLDTELIKKIEKLSEGTERDFSKQVKFMLREYIKFKENN